MNDITVKCNGNEFYFDSGTTLLKLAKEFQQYYPEAIIAAIVNGKVRELTYNLRGQSVITFITLAETLGMNIYRRTGTFIMIKACYDVLGDNGKSRVKVQYSADKGLYCEIISDTVKVNDEMVAAFKNRMQELVDRDLPITKHTMVTEDAIELFDEMNLHDKANLLKYRNASTVNTYLLDGNTDYYYGYMAPSTGYVKTFDIIPYDEGFVLNMPSKKNTSKLLPFNPSEKLFNVLKEATRWSQVMGIETVGDLNDVISAGKFNDLILVQEALMEKKIGLMAEQIKKEGKRIVMIAGPSSSGKTTFSHRLSIQLIAHGLKPHPMGDDIYFVNRKDTPLDENGKYDFECLEAIDIERFNHDIKGLLKGEEVDLPIFDFVIGERSSKTQKMQIAKDDVLVIEGIHCLNDK
ncbi:MAG: nucleoside kinase, partial [Lachnospiraceae bacterium]|nr:nucleoside kinase [Lachnospiraceae bacterium]